MSRLLFPLAACLAFCLGLPAAAQDFPALYDVVDVAQDDVLNVRREPNASSEIVGTLSPSQAGVEVIKTDGAGKWGFVNLGEQSGWASLRYMQAVPDGYLPKWQALSCSGTEPFWGLSIQQGQTATFDEFGDAKSYAIGNLTPASGRFWPYAIFGESGPDRMSAVIAPGYCDDGMSDQEFGLTVALILEGADRAFYSGCCTLDSGN
ncbi:SH3 domain-containing protein [Primorskyibacter sp. 2E233]|uniref:SH3 domain-containing protein n=1 Tax=Primorskyibacter sp. 2E233 TaxID=3413431 RepID=UPI003BF2A594